MISCLKGGVIGGGLELAASTHIRVCEPSTFFQLPEGQRGTFLGGSGSVRIPRLLGPGRVVEMMLTARRVEIEEGMRLGHRLVGDGEGLSAALEVARAVCANLPSSNYAIINGIRRIVEMSPGEGLFAEVMTAFMAGSVKGARRKFRSSWTASGGPNRAPTASRLERKRRLTLMTDARGAYIIGAYEHPTRKAPNVSTSQLHAEVAAGALADCGLGLDDVDGYFCAANAPGLGPFSMAEHVGLRNLRYVDSTEVGGSSYIFHVSHAMQAIAQGRCNVALITMADRPIGGGSGVGLAGVDMSNAPGVPFEPPIPQVPVYGYAMVAKRHMHEFGATPEQWA